MRPTVKILLALLLLAPQAAFAQGGGAAGRAWKPSFASFRRAVKERWYCTVFNRCRD